MKSKIGRVFEGLETKVSISLQKGVKEIHPVVKDIVNALGKLQFIRFIRVSPDCLQASNEITQGRIKIPITKPGHPTAIGVHLIIDLDYKEIQFFEITSAVKGCGGKMAGAALNALPKDWKGFVVMDWSRGFWTKMKSKYNNLYIL
jgi:hypothetical protein